MTSKLAPLAALLWACAAQAQEGDSTYRGYVGAGAAGSLQLWEGGRSNSIGGGLTVGVWPGRRLVDDGAPLSMQAFLQRPDELRLSLSGSALQAAYDSIALTGDGYGLSANVSGGHWFSRVYLGGGLLAEREHEVFMVGQAQSRYPSNQFTRLEPDVMLAVHWSVVHLSADVQWRFFWDDQRLKAPPMFRIALSAQALVAQTTYLEVRAYTFQDGGGGARLTVEVFPSATLGIYGQLVFEDGAIYYNTSKGYSRVGLELGAGIWLTHALRLDPFLAAATVSPDGGGAANGGVIEMWNLRGGASLNWRFR